MRVIAGKHKGRRLSCPKGNVVRPTTDKVKEAMFGSIQFKIAGAKVLDAFAGSGSLGIEALSRGAAHVDFVENNRDCLRALTSNLDMLDDGNYTIIKGDLRKSASRLQTYDIVFLDPPYDAKLYLPTLNMAHERGLLEQGCTIVMESRRKFDFILPKEYNFIKRKDYGDISLWFLEYGEKR
jgi:16S rRNA (guanine966-N2)-methyltransferase